jgi:hypothetical protein
MHAGRDVSTMGLDARSRRFLRPFPRRASSSDCEVLLCSERATGRRYDIVLEDDRRIAAGHVWLA